MNGINRRGQKVSCIMRLEVIDVLGTPYEGPIPVVDATYTVADFADSRMVLEGAPLSSASTQPGIVLLELPPVRTRSGKICGWPIMAFVPLVSTERYDSISQMIDDAGRAIAPRTREDA